MAFVHEGDIEALKRRIISLENRLGNINYEMKGVVKAELTASSTILDQSQAQFGMYTALCLETIDVWKQNRVRWFSPIFHNPKRPVKEFPWALPVSSMGGFDDCGLTWVPPAGSKLCIVFENGNRTVPYYLGTTWDRDRGSASNRKWGTAVEEFQKVSAGHRKGYLVGPDDESQVFPPWNTENYNGFDLSSIVDFSENPEAQKLITYPHIYGFKTPEKHTIKMVDGDPKCNRKWKRFEIMSSCGNWIMLKDDHLHYAGQWAHPECGVQSGETSCVQGASNLSKNDVIRGGFTTNAAESSGPNLRDTSPKEGVKSEENSCTGQTSNSKIIGGHPSTSAAGTKYINTQIGSNPYFKQKQECRPYKGPQTPQNPVVDLPQSGIQLMSISGHTFVMDDSVQEPFGDPTWERSTKEFDFGCNNIYQGRTYWQSATGHSIEMSDVELDENPNIRDKNNYIRILSASGNKIELNDHTLPGCKAGEKRGIFLESTSKHAIQMVDDTNKQCSSNRMNGGKPINESNKAFVKIRTGYGLEMTFNDDFDQKKMDKQFIQIYCPRTGASEGGPHFHRYQEADPALIFLRSGGYHIKSTHKDDISIIGDFDESPSDKIELISKVKLVYSKDYYINLSDKSHVFIAKELIYLLAGQDCPSPGGDQKGPCVGPVLVYQGGCIKLSDRVYASCSQDASTASMFMLKPFAKCNP